MLIVSLIVIALSRGLVALGMAGYARIQRMSLVIGLIVLVDHVRPDAGLLAGRTSRLRSIARR